MEFMKWDDHIDPDTFDIFIKQRIYLDYADEFLDPEQIDHIDEAKIAEPAAGLDHLRWFPDPRARPYPRHLSGRKTRYPFRSVETKRRSCGDRCRSK